MFDVNKAARKLFYENKENERRNWETLDEGSKSYWRYLARKQHAALVQQDKTHSCEE